MANGDTTVLYPSRRASAYIAKLLQQGLLTRIAAKLAAVNLGRWLNRLFGRPPLAFATLFTG